MARLTGEDKSITNLSDVRAKIAEEGKASKDREQRAKGDAVVRRSQDFKDRRAELASEQIRLQEEIVNSFGRGELSKEKLKSALQSFEYEGVERAAILRNCIGRAAGRGDINLAEELIDLEPNADAQDRDRGMIVIALARSGDKKRARQALEKVQTPKWRANAERQISN